MDDYYRDSPKEDKRYYYIERVSKDKDSRRRMFWVSNRSRKRAEERNRRRRSDGKYVNRLHLGGVFK